MNTVNAAAAPARTVAVHPANCEESEHLDIAELALDEQPGAYSPQVFMRRISTKNDERVPAELDTVIRKDPPRFDGAQCLDQAGLPLTVDAGARWRRRGWNAEADGCPIRVVAEHTLQLTACRSNREDIDVRERHR